MNFKVTLILAAILTIGIVSVVYLDKQDKKEEEVKQEESKLLDFDKDKVQEVYLLPSAVRAIKDSNSWQILDPVRTEADVSSFDAIINMFDWAKKDRIVSSDTNEYRAFGLVPPRAQLVLKHEDGTDTVYVGDRNPTGSNIFARVSGSPDVFISTTSLGTNISKTLFDLRKKNVLAFERNEAREFMLKNMNGSYTLKNTGGDWVLTHPIDYKADQDKVSNILSRVSNQVATEFVEEDPDDLRKYGLDKPMVTLKIKLGENLAEKSLIIGNLDEDKYYARDESKNPVFKVDSSFVQVFRLALNDLLNKKLSDFTSTRVTKLVVQFRDSTVICQKDTSDNWMVMAPVERKAKNWKISGIVNEIANLKADDFASHAPNSLRPYGLENPGVSCEVYQNNILLKKIYIGNKKDENTVYVKLEDEKTVFITKKSILEKLQINLDEIIDETETKSSSDSADVS